MPMYRKVNTDFFKMWTPEMFYVLGFFAADGNMVQGARGNYYISFHITDRSLLAKIRQALGSDHKITERNRGETLTRGYQLQIGSKEIYQDLINLGMKPNKSSTLLFPVVPLKLLPHFVRGYFDGDGGVSVGRYRRNDVKKRTSRTILQTRFTSGSRRFLEGLQMVLCSEAHIKLGALYSDGGAWRLSYSILDSLSLYTYMYPPNTKYIFLSRKKKIFDAYIQRRRR